MALKDCVELEFAENPSRLLEELGLQTKQFEATKSNILTRLIGRPDLAMIVLEFRRGGMYYGEVQYNDTERYRQARTRRSEIIGQSARRDQDRPKEPEAGGDDGVSDGSTSDGWSLEQLLSSQLAES